jgi:hypothetical protein
MADRADGWLARKAVNHGIPITDKDKKKDPFQDKIFFHMIIGSIAIREYLDGNNGYAAVLALSQLGTAVRDHKMTRSRENAVENAEVKAIAINKYKTGLQNITHVEATSPLAEYSAGRVLIAASYIMTNIMGVIGYNQAHKIHQTPGITQETT